MGEQELRRRRRRKRKREKIRNREPNRFGLPLYMRNLLFSSS